MRGVRKNGKIFIQSKISSYTVPTINLSNMPQMWCITYMKWFLSWNIPTYVYDLCIHVCILYMLVCSAVIVRLNLRMLGKPTLWKIGVVQTCTSNSRYIWWNLMPISSALCPDLAYWQPHLHTKCQIGDSAQNGILKSAIARCLFHF